MIDTHEIENDILSDITPQPSPNFAAKVISSLSRTRRTPVQAAASCDASPYFERRRFITVFVSLHSSSISGRRSEQLGTPFP